MRLLGKFKAAKKEASHTAVVATQAEPATTKASKSNGNLDDDFTHELIKQINKDAGERIAFNLGKDEAPTVVKRWISTGSRGLDYIIANARNGGFPEGRIVEIQGSASCGKSHICYEICKSTQRLGGIVVYIDTENATSLDNLKLVGIDVTKRFVFIQTNCTEEVFKAAESAIMKARALAADVPVTIIWDSVAASSPKAEIEGEYDANTIGLQARVIGKGLRKIANIIANQKVLFVIVNQIRMKIGVMFGNPETTPGGMAIPYACSVRIKVSPGSPIKKMVDGKEVVVGIDVTAKTIKNKVNRPFREVDFAIHFGKGVIDHEHLFDYVREYCEKNPVSAVDPAGREVTIALEGLQAWKSFMVTDKKTGEVLVEKKFHKPDFKAILENAEYKFYMDTLLDAAYIMNPNADNHPTCGSIDASSSDAPRDEK